MRFLQLVKYSAVAAIFLSIPACVGGSAYEAAEYSQLGRVLFWSGFLTLIVAGMCEGE